MYDLTKRDDVRVITDHAPAMYEAIRNVVFDHPLGQTGPCVTITRAAYDRLVHVAQAMSTDSAAIRQADYNVP